MVVLNMITTDIGRKVLLGIALLATAGAGTNRATAVARASGLEQTDDRRVIRMTAERFAFMPSRIVVETGEAIELRIASDDTAHGLRIQGTDVNIVVPKRGLPETTVTFTAPAPGKYSFECTRLCGAGHNFMRGELVVRERGQGGKRR
jgi:cytochrome c oxidase subunit II